MNKRKQVMLALQNLEAQFLSQQQQINAHARYLSAWYTQHRVKLNVLVITVSIGLTVMIKALQKRFPVVKPWLKRIRLGAIWLFDLLALNPQTIKALFSHFTSEVRRLK